MATTEKSIIDFIREDASAASPEAQDPHGLLTKLQFSETAQQIILNPSSFSADQTGLSGIQSSNELLIQVRKSLAAIIDSVNDNPSIFTRLTTFWGTLPLWKKIIGGVAVSGPTLVIGFAANIGFLLALSSVSVGAYTTVSVVLDDHLEHTKEINKKLKDGVFAIADVLVLTISALEVIREKLETEVRKFQEENTKLSDNVNNLGSQVDALRLQIESNRVTERFLRKTTTELEQTAVKLAENLDKNQEEHHRTVAQIQEFQKDHERVVTSLSEQVTLLTQKRADLELELQKTRSLATILQGTVSTLSTAVISDKKEKQTFQDKLEAFLSSKEKSFGEVATRMGETETELSSVKSRLEESLGRHELLMKKQSELIERLAKLDKPAIEEDPTVASEGLSDSQILRSIGFMSAPAKSIVDILRPEENPTIIAAPV